VLRALARGHGLCPESMVSGGDNRPFLLQFQFFGHTGSPNGPCFLKTQFARGIWRFSWVGIDGRNRIDEHRRDD
jgi:hypothetical protein